MMHINKGDIEYGGGRDGQLYPMMLESPELRWAFIRKVYVILSIQLLLTVAVAATVVSIPQISHFLLNTKPGLAVYIVVLILPLLHVFDFVVVGIGTVLFPLFAYHKRHPVNLILLALFTVFIAFSVGLSCSFTKGRIILEAAILTSVVVVSLTLYTFYAVRRGHDFSFLGPFLFASMLVLMVFVLIQIFFPLGKLSMMIYGFLASIIFCGYIVYDTDNLIKRFDYDQYIWAAVSLYLDIINLFLSLLTLLRAADN